MARSALMLVLPLPIYRCGAHHYLDEQACNGLRLWLDHFDIVRMLNPEIVVPDPPMGTTRLRDVVPSERLEVVPLPSAWTPLRFARHAWPTMRRLDAVMRRSTFLHFAIGGLFGDWGAIAGLMAHRRKLKWAVWTDRVESNVIRASADRKTGLQRLYTKAVARGSRWLERAAIRRADLGLFHGMDTYREYAPLAAQPHLVHDVHLGEEYRIEAAALAAKVARASEGAPLRIIYGGRAHPDKGMLDWIETLALLRDTGTPFRATWFGDGPERQSARALVTARGLGDLVDLPGNLADRGRLMAAFREAEIFLFCHKTAESPRCLIEALLNGSPIVGYGREYPRDLIAAHGGGLLTEPTPAALADGVSALHRDRSRLADLIRRAAADGHPMVDHEVFRHRAGLMRAIANAEPAPNP